GGWRSVVCSSDLPGDDEVHPPAVELERDAREGADRIDVEEGGMACGVDGPADGGDVAGHAGGGLVVDDEHTPDLVRRVGAERLLDPLRRSSLPPLDVDHVNGEAVPDGAVG